MQATVTRNKKIDEICKNKMSATMVVLDVAHKRAVTKRLSSRLTGLLKRLMLAWAELTCVPSLLQSTCFFLYALLFSCKTTSQQGFPLRRLIKTPSSCYCPPAAFSRRPALAGQTASVTISVLESVDRCRQCSWAEAQRAWRWSQKHSRVLIWTLVKDNTQWGPGVAQVRLLQANLHQTATHCTVHTAASYRSTEPSKTFMHGRLKGPFLGLFSAAATTAR